MGKGKNHTSRKCGSIRRVKELSRRETAEAKRAAKMRRRMEKRAARFGIAIEEEQAAPGTD